jgi:hypothetical protein
VRLKPLSATLSHVAKTIDTLPIESPTGYDGPAPDGVEIVIVQCELPAIGVTAMVHLASMSTRHLSVKLTDVPVAVIDEVPLLTTNLPAWMPAVSVEIVDVSQVIVAMLAVKVVAVDPDLDSSRAVAVSVTTQVVLIGPHVKLADAVGANAHAATTTTSATSPSLAVSFIGCKCSYSWCWGDGPCGLWCSLRAVSRAGCSVAPSLTAGEFRFRDDRCLHDTLVLNDCQLLN